MVTVVFWGIWTTATQATLCGRVRYFQAACRTRTPDDRAVFLGFLASVGFVIQKTVGFLLPFVLMCPRHGGIPRPLLVRFFPLGRARRVRFRSARVRRRGRRRFRVRAAWRHPSCA